MNKLAIWPWYILCCMLLGWYGFAIVAVGFVACLIYVLIRDWRISKQWEKNRKEKALKKCNCDK